MFRLSFSVLTAVQVLSGKAEYRMVGTKGCQMLNIVEFGLCFKEEEALQKIFQQLPTTFLLSLRPPKLVYTPSTSDMPHCFCSQQFLGPNCPPPLHLFKCCLSLAAILTFKTFPNHPSHLFLRPLQCFCGYLLLLIFLLLIIKYSLSFLLLK